MVKIQGFDEYPYLQLFEGDVESITSVVRDTIPAWMRPVVWEIGCWGGATTLLLMELLKPTSLNCVDTFDGRGSILQDAAKGRDIMALLRENLSHFDCPANIYLADSKVFCQFVADESADVIFVDGDHRYEGVLADIRGWYPKLKPSGVIMGHDFDGKTYDEDLVNKDNDNGYHHGVVKAVLGQFPGVQNNGRVWYHVKNDQG